MAGFFSDVKAGGGAPFGGAVDLHGMLTADALSYTLIGHGRHDLPRTRLREASKAIHRVSEKVLAWSPLIVPNDTPKEQNGCTPTAEAGAEACARIYGQTWGTVYDTINYTVTGAMGDWFDSPAGLGTDGLDNEMAFSHLDRNIEFDPQGEQLHVDGNKALIYAQLRSSSARRARRSTRPAQGLRGRNAAAPGRARQPDRPAAGVGRPGEDHRPVGFSRPGRVVFDLRVKLGRQPQDGSADAGKDVFNGGLRVDITKLNAAGISDGNAQTTLKVQCRLRRPSGNRAGRRRVHHRRGGLQPVARLRAGRPHGRGQPAAGQEPRG